MDAYEELLRKLGLLHLKNDPDALQEEILRELGMLELKGDHEAIQRRSEEILRQKEKEFESTRKTLGKLLQKHTLKRNN